MTADELARLLDELGQRLGPAGERVFALSVRWQVTQGIVGTLMFLLVVALGVYAGPRFYRWVQGGDSYSDRAIVGALGFGFYAVIALFLTLNFFVFALPTLFNAEYAAIKDLLGAVSGAAR